MILVVPGAKLLQDCYEAVVREDAIRPSVEKLCAEAATMAIKTPPKLKERVEALLRKHPHLRWDAAVALVARQDHAFPGKAHIGRLFTEREVDVRIGRERDAAGAGQPELQLGQLAREISAAAHWRCR